MVIDRNMRKVLLFFCILFAPYGVMAQVAQDSLKDAQIVADSLNVVPMVQDSLGVQIVQDSLKNAQIVADSLNIVPMVQDSLSVQVAQDSLKNVQTAADSLKVKEVKKTQVVKPLSIDDFNLEETALTARSKPYEKVDGNGERYAIIKIVSNDPEDDLNAYDFDFGRVEDFDAKNSDGERWLYVGRNATRVTIQREGYKTVRDYELGYTIKSGMTYTLELKVTVERVHKRSVLFQIQPADSEADIYYRKKGESIENEVYLGRIDEFGEFQESLELGEYYYRLVSPDFEIANGPINLENADSAYVVNETLVSKFSKVELKAEDDAEIYLDGKLIGKNSCVRRMKNGRYEVECRKAGYASSVTLVAIDEKKDTIISLEPMTPLYGTLEIKSSPSKAEIIIDGESYGHTPQYLTKILVGEHTLALYKPEFGTKIKKIKIEKDNIHKEKVDLIKTTSVGDLSISSVPAGAEIRINGNYFGTTPKVIKNLPYGNYKVSLSMDGYEPQSKQLSIRYRTVLEETFFFDGAPEQYMNAVAGKNTYGNNAIQDEEDSDELSGSLIKSKPEKAKLFVDGKYMGLTPCRVQLEPGKYDLRLEHEKYRKFKTATTFSGVDTTYTYKMKRKQQRPWALYLQGTGGYTQHGRTEVGANLGIYFLYLNFEAYALHGFDTETVYFNYDNAPQTTHTLKSFLYGARAGFGIICGNRVRITPQVGAGLLSIYGNDVYTSVITGTAGLRIECSIINHIGVCLVPEYSMVMPTDKIDWNKDKLYHQIEAISPKIKNWANGFKCYFGLYFYL